MKSPAVAALLPTILRPEDAEAIEPFGLEIYLPLDTAATYGHKPGEGPPDHIHFVPAARYVSAS